MVFLDRESAGKQLVATLEKYKGSDAVVMALPRGGVVTGVEVAKALHLPIGLILVRKIGHPSDSEYAIGAVADGARPVYNESEIAEVDSTWLKLEEEAAEELIELRRQEYFDHTYPQPEVADKDVIIVDDGIATGLTMRASIGWARSHSARRVIVAAPVASRDVFDMLAKEADEVHILIEPDHFLGAVGAHYDKFTQVDDFQVRQLMRRVQI